MQGRIVIDPGHGGSEINQSSTPFGARGPSGVLEKNVNLALAERLAQRLGSSATLTRNNDSNPSLARRAEAAASEAADVFVSLHANAGPPSEHGTEIYVHERAGDNSRSLAQSVAQSLVEYGLAQRGLRAAPLSVLSPDHLGPRAAACLVEVDYLSHPEGERRLGDPRELDAIADHLSRGIRSYLGQRIESADARYGRRPRTRYGDSDDANYFKDADQLNAMLRDERAADTRRVSSVADALARVQDYLDRGASTVWPHLSADVVADQIARRCEDHRLFQQGNLNLCGPASFLCIWAGRDPCGYANYALGMLENGVGRIGSHSITGTQTLREIPYPRLGRSGSISTPAADFLCMAPLRHDANEILPYDPSSRVEPLEGITTPGEIAEWLNWTGVFSTVRDEGNWTSHAGLDHALSLLVGGGSDVAMLIHVNALASAAHVERVAAGATGNPFVPDGTFILSSFPNHFVVLLSELTPDHSDNTVSLSAWTWAGSYVFSGIPVRSFSENYFGAVKAIMRSN